MKQGWQIKKLGEVCLDFIVPQRDKPTAFDGDIPWCRIEDIEGRYLNGSKSGQKVSKELAEKMNMHLCPKGTIISACSASIGNQAITTIECYTNQTFIGIVANPEMLYNVYLYYFLESKTNELKELGQGATIKYISKDKYKQMLIPVPPLSEQGRIVDFLDDEFAKIDALKANAEKNLQNAKDLFQAALNELIIENGKLEGGKWKSSKLKTICSKIGSGATPLGGKRTYGKEGVSLIRSLNVYNNEFHYEDLAHINEEQARQLSNVEIKEDDVLFNITGASVTRCCKVPKEVLPARVNQHVSILRLLPNTLLPNFLVYMLISPHHNSALMKMAENGATRQAITKKQLEEWEITYPETISDQQSIVARLDALNEKCQTLQANYEKTLRLCEDLKQALLRREFEIEN